MSRRLGKAALGEALSLLPTRSARHLRTEWQEAFGIASPPGLTRDLLVRALAYRLQEQAEGGLSKACQRVLQNLAAPGTREGGSASLLSPLSPGMRLVRDWGGRTHTVHVLEAGFEYRGERFRSLTGIARRITGARWSGPRFFGVDT